MWGGLKLIAMSSPSPMSLTPSEYLRLERQSDVRSEYIGGRAYATAGASRRHNVISGNILAALKGQLRSQPCEAYMADMRVRIAAAGTYTYPDIAAVCGEPRFEDELADTLVNPSLIVEVLSDSTEAYDRGEKFAQYRSLDSLREYVLVAQNKARVEHYQREGERWVLTEIHAEDGRVRLTSVNCELAIADVYAGVVF